MKLSPIALALLLGMGFNYQASAAQVPVPAPQDKRVRFVDYDPDNIVTVKTKIGRDTLIIFGKNEQILDMGGGYTDAWGVGTLTQRNGFFIKPKKESPATNIHIVTNLRYYNLDMVMATGREANYEFIKYRYPAEEAKLKQAKANIELAKKYLSYGDSTIKNANYTIQGSDSIAPDSAEDNGQATFVTFPPGNEIPQVYYINEEGKEVQANVNFNNGVMVIHHVKAKFVFRRGELVTCLFNESYGPNSVMRPKTKTSSPRVERLMKEVEQ